MKYSLTYNSILYIITGLLISLCPLTLYGEEIGLNTTISTSLIDSTANASSKLDINNKILPLSPYELPYSVTSNSYDWHRLWVNTATLSTAFVGTLLVLECLPEDATSWNRAELQDVPLFKR